VTLTGQLLLPWSAPEVAIADLVQLASCPLEPTLDRAFVAATHLLIRIITVHIVKVIVTVRVGQRLAVVGQTTYVDPAFLEIDVVLQCLQLAHQLFAVHVRLSGQHRRMNLFDTLVDPFDLSEDQVALRLEIQVPHLSKQIA